THSKVYFDLSTVLEPLENRSSIEVEVVPAPQGKLYSRQLTVVGDVQKQSYHEWLRKQALDRHLHGHIKRVFHDTIEIAIAGTDEEDVEDFKKCITEKAKVEKIKDKPREDFDKVGFEISERYNTANFRSAATALIAFHRDLTEFDGKKDQVTEVTRYIKESNACKFTMPVRKLSA